MEGGKNLDNTIEESLGVQEATCIESVVRNWRDPTLHSKSCKEAAYKPRAKLRACKEGVGGVHSTRDFADNKTADREGTLLYSSFQRR
jgi:hypothetical protein